MKNVKNVILGMVFLFGVQLIDANNFQMEQVDCFQYADTRADAAQATWGLSDPEAFEVFERYYWTCELGNAL